MNKRLLSVVLVALMAVALVVGSVMVSAADGITTVDQLDKAGANGGNYKLGTNVGPDFAGKSDLSGSIIEVGTAGKAINLTLDLNGYTIKDVTITVKPGCTLTIKDTDSNNAGLITESEFVVEGSKVGDKTNTATLVIASGTIDDTTIDAGDYSNVTVEGGTITCDASTNAITVDGTSASVTVKGGTITAGTALNVVKGSATVSDSAKLVNPDGSSASVVYVAEDGKLTVKGGEITVTDKAATGAKALSVNGGKANLDGGTVTGAVYMADSADIRVNGATVKGDISHDGKNGDLDVLSGDIQGEIKVDDANILGGTFTKQPIVDEDATTMIFVTDKKVNAKGDGVDTWERYVVGNEIINATLKTLDSFKFKDVQYNDTFEVIVDKKTIDADVVNGGVYGTYAGKDTPHNTKINGEVLGSNLQQGTAYDKAITSGQPMHKWGEVVKATPYVCGADVVLTDYVPDTLNADQYIVANDKGEMTSVNGKYTVELTDAEGNAYIEAITKKPFTYVCKDGGVVPVIKKAGHLANPVAFKAPTTTEAGVYQHYKCEICGKVFATFTWNQNGFGGQGLEVDPAQLVIPAIGAGTSTPSDPTPTDPGKKPDEGGSDVTTDPGKTGDVDNFAWVVCLAVSAIGAVAVAGSMVASKKYDR